MPAIRAELRLRSYAKVNLGLEVLGLREDGYHELRTLFQMVDLYDEITLRPREEGVRVSCDHPLVPADETNLAFRAAEDLRRYCGVDRGIEIEIRKRIPVGGGLGGGSSNAAAVLLGLDRHWKLGLGQGGLHPLARRLGADVPFFLLGGTALGLGRGDEVYPLHHQIQAHLVLVDPGLHVSTTRVFARVDASLTPREKSNSIFYFVSRELEGSGAFRLLSNDLEAAAFEEAPELRKAAGPIKAALAEAGALLSALSGSGATYFGLFKGLGPAQRACGKLASEGFQARVVRTVRLDAYRAAWGRMRIR